MPVDNKNTITTLRAQKYAFNNERSRSLTTYRRAKQSVCHDIWKQVLIETDTFQTELQILR